MSGGTSIDEKLLQKKEKLGVKESYLFSQKVDSWNFYENYIGKYAAI